MSALNTAFVRRAAAAGVVGGSITAVGGLIVQTVVQPTTTVSDKMWSYPWSSSALVPISLLWALAHALVLVALLGLYRSGMAGHTRAARSGVLVAIAGTSLLFAGELASIAVRHQRVDAAGATAVGVLFGIAILLSAIGFLIAGRAAMRAGQWGDWRRFTPLATGVWTALLLGVNSTKALPTGVAVYGLCLLALSVALYTRPSPADDLAPDGTSDTGGLAGAPLARTGGMGSHGG